MLFFYALLLLASAENGLGEVNVTLTCDEGPIVTADVTGGTVGGRVKLDATCDGVLLGSASESVVFETPACTLQYDTEYVLVVTSDPDIYTDSDYAQKFSCSFSETAITAVEINAEGADDLSDATGITIDRTITVAFKDADDITLTSGSVGDTVSVTASTSDEVDFYLEGMSVSDGTVTVDLVMGGCTKYDNLLSSPTGASENSMSFDFSLFLLSSSSVEAVSSVTFTFTFQLCDDACQDPTCNSNRRKRNVDVLNSTSETVEVTSALIIYPAGKAPKGLSNLHAGSDENENFCMTRTPLIATTVSMSVALVLCIAITGWMFSRLKRPLAKLNEAQSSSFCNSGYKA